MFMVPFHCLEFKPNKTECNFSPQKKKKKKNQTKPIFLDGALMYTYKRLIYS